MARQRFDLRRMFESDGQEFKIIPADFFIQKRGAGFSQFQFLQPGFDRRFPTTGDTHNFSIVGILDYGFGGGGEERIVPENQSIACVSSSKSLTPCSPGSPQAVHRSRETSNATYLWRCLLY